MTNNQENLDRLMAQIADATAEARTTFQPALSRLIDAMLENGEPVSAEAKLLNEELVNEAIESQFDNMPV